MRADQERVRALLRDTVTLLCKNGLAYDKELRVQGLLGITLDENEVFIVHINEKCDGSHDTDMNFSQTALELAINNNNVKPKFEVSPPKDRPAKRSRKPRLDSPIPNKKSHTSLSPKSALYESFYNKINNNNNVLEIKPDDCRDDNCNVISDRMAVEDDRNAMRDCYNSDSNDMTTKMPSVIPPPPPLALYGDKRASPNIKQTAEDLSTNNSDDFNDLKQPDPSMGGPFIAGVAHHHIPQPLTNSESSDHSWEELGGPIGPLTPDGGVVLEGATTNGHQASRIPNWGDESEDSEDKLATQKQIQDSLMLYGMAHFSPSASSLNGDPESAANRKLKEGRRSWTSKNKPYGCKVEGCNKSYFFVHDLRRHERQKHPDRPPANLKNNNPQPDLPLDFSTNSPTPNNSVLESSPTSIHNGASSDVET